MEKSFKVNEMSYIVPFPNNIISFTYRKYKMKDETLLSKADFSRVPNTITHQDEECEPSP